MRDNVSSQILWHGSLAIVALVDFDENFRRCSHENGLHVYTEKLLTCSQERELRLGGAPDTLLGAALQCAREVIDNKLIGDVVFGQANFISGGMEHRRPNPEFFFKPGGGPIFDIGPYYVTALVSLLGPVASVSAIGTIGRPIRSVSTPGSPHQGALPNRKTVSTFSGSALAADAVSRAILSR